MSEPLEDSPALPQSQVLSYLTSISTPTRVRRVARLGLRWTAALCAVVVLVTIAATAYDWIHAFLLGRLRTNNLVSESSVPLVFVIVFTACGLFQWFLAPLVEAGSQRASSNLQITLLPAALVLVFFAVLSGGAGVSAFVLIPQNNPPLAVWYHCLLVVGGVLGILISLAGAVALLLVVDLSKLLTWISQQPAAEKPPTPFLS